jgi:ubiquitin-like protein Pup
MAHLLLPSESDDEAQEQVQSRRLTLMAQLKTKEVRPARPAEQPERSEKSELTKKGAELKEELDELLDEIDDILEENAEEFVASYVQRGGE